MKRNVDDPTASGDMNPGIGNEVRSLVPGVLVSRTPRAQHRVGTILVVITLALVGLVVIANVLESQPDAPTPPSSPTVPFPT